MKFKDIDEAKAALESTQEEAKVARGEIKNMKKEFGVKGDETPADPKQAKKLKRAVDLLDSKDKAISEIKTYIKENKPKKEAKPRVFKYDYPADYTTPEQKKKYRAEERARKKREDKAAAKGEAPAKKKGGKKVEEVVPIKSKKRGGKEEAAPIKKKKKQLAKVED